MDSMASCHTCMDPVSKRCLEAIFSAPGRLCNVGTFVSVAVDSSRLK